MLCTAALWGAMDLTLTGAHGAVSDIGTHAAPAAVDTARAAYYLADADRVAAESMLSGTVRLGGPGQRYQDDLKTAHQALEQAAEHDATGTAGSGQLQAVEGLLVEYTSLVEQAHANAGQGVLGAAYLTYASGLLHTPGDGILTRIEQLRQAERQVAAERGRSVWLAPGVLFGVLAPAVVALALLVGTQRFLRRHFKRRLSPALLAGSVLLVGLAGWGLGQSLHADRAFGSATAALDRLSASWQARSLAAQAAASDSLALVQDDPAAPFASDFTGYATKLADPLPDPAARPAGHAGPPQFHGILADLLRAGSAPTNPATPAEQDAAGRALDSFQRFTAADARLQQQAAQHSPDAAVTAVGTGSTQLGGTGAALDGDLSSLAALTQQRLAGAQTAARAELGLDVGLPVLCAGIAALCLAGLWPRIDEYRAAR
ncbi:hypothetical protein [Kitasatospora sp. MAP5-34]|uniref:hypothetical protein n=1 Tax=Kitasatospora sp. MAP5-34 TaxID=3035102 RepID=UPI0024734EA6|nr:hypothetical protein [Kitasatospora sp. MAP5-34]MDH6576178.1 hypothetical protein [Kitasatospora sp. MAP5-34]